MTPRCFGGRAAMPSRTIAAQLGALGAVGRPGLAIADEARDRLADRLPGAAARPSRE